MAIFNLPKLAHPDFVDTKRKPVSEFGIDWENPITKGLDFLTYLNTATAKDLISGAIASNVNQSQRIGTEEGLVFNFDGVGDRAIFTNESTLDTTKPYTIVTRARLASYTDGYPVLVSFKTTETIPLLIFYSNDAGYEAISFGQRATWRRKASSLSASTVGDNDFHTVVLTFNGGVNRSLDANYSLYWEGMRQTSIAASEFGATTNETCVGGTSATNNDWNGDVGFVGRFQGVEWSTAQARDFTKNPYQIIKPTQELTFVSDEAAAAAIISVGGDDVVLDAEANVAFVTSGFSSEISTVQLVSGTSITNATGVTSTSGTGDFDLPDITGYVVDTVGCPLTTANNIVVARLTDA